MNNTDLDQLKEVASVAAGNGATALSKFVGEEVTINVSRIQVCPVEKVPDLLGDRERMVTTVLVQISGDAKGMILFLFDPQSASKLVSQLTKQQNISENLNGMELSALCELANIMVGSGLKAVNEFLHLKIMQGVPDTAIDMIGALTDPVLSQLGEKSEQILALEVSVSGREWNFTTMFLADPKSTVNVLESIEKLKNEHLH